MKMGWGGCGGLEVPGIFTGSAGKFCLPLGQFVSPGGSPAGVHPMPGTVLGAGDMGVSTVRVVPALL